MNKQALVNVVKCVPVEVSTTELVNEIVTVNDLDVSPDLDYVVTRSGNRYYHNDTLLMRTSSLHGSKVIEVDVHHILDVLPGWIAYKRSDRDIKLMPYSRISLLEDMPLAATVLDAARTLADRYIRSNAVVETITYQSTSNKSLEMVEVVDAIEVPLKRLSA